MVSRVGPIHDFGLMMAIGAVMTLPACALLLPALTLVGDGGKLPPPEKHGPLTALLEPDARVVEHARRDAGRWAPRCSPWSAFFGSQRLERETAFTENFRETTPIVQAYNFVEDEFGGAGVWDLLVPVGDAAGHEARPGRPAAAARRARRSPRCWTSRRNC